MTTPTPADLGILKSSAWKAIRRTHEAATPDAFADAAEAMQAVDDAAEAYRVAHHPDALTVFVTCDHERGQPLEVYAIYASGLERVYPPSKPTPKPCDCGALALPVGAYIVCIDQVEHSETACVGCVAS